jgi:hypothetical protein
MHRLTTEQRSNIVRAAKEWLGIHTTIMRG